MYCSKCGNKMQAGEMFCRNCGTPRKGLVTEPTAPVQVNPVTAEVAASTDTNKEPAQTTPATAATPSPATPAAKKKPPKKALIIIPVLLALIAIGILVYLHFFTYRSVKVEEYDGNVELERNGSEKDLFEGLKLIPKDMVTTGEDGLIELFIDSDKHVVTEANTCFSVNAVGNENSGKVTIDLQYGSTLITIDEKLAENSEFEVETPNVLCSVRGTTFEVEYDKQSHTSEVAVTEGVVKLKTENEELELTAGQKAVVTDDEIKTYVLFGTYEQDGNLSNGSEPIEWEVLDYSDDGKSALLMSRYALERKAFDESGSDDKWANSSLRSWLNNEFYDQAFTDDEMNMILTTDIVTADNPISGSDGGPDTKDKVFLLSVDELVRYYSFDSWDDEQMTGYSSQLLIDMTPYAKAQMDGLYCNTITDEYYNENLLESGLDTDVIGRSGCWWWLRSSGGGPNEENRYFACRVHQTGRGGWTARLVDDAGVGVRPAMWVNIDVINAEQQSYETDDNSVGAGWSSFPGQGNVWDENRAWTDRNDILPHQEGDYIVFGAYEQDNDLTNGPEPIEWVILDTNENGTLLISRYILDNQPYNDDHGEVTWETCTLRQWLNNDFMNKAFTAAEQNFINSVTITIQDLETTSDSNVTTDKIFLLSDKERLNYPFEDSDEGGGNNSALRTTPTEYANISSYRCDYWWLRSPMGSNGTYACGISADYTGSSFMNNGSPTGVRPAIYISQ